MKTIETRTGITLQIIFEWEKGIKNTDHFCGGLLVDDKKKVEDGQRCGKCLMAILGVMFEVWTAGSCLKIALISKDSFQ